MPKIHHAIVIFVVGTLSIAFNSVHYPMRVMVAVPAAPPSASPLSETIEQKSEAREPSEHQPQEAAASQTDVAATTPMKPEDPTTNGINGDGNENPAERAERPRLPRKFTQDAGASNALPPPREDGSDNQSKLASVQRPSGDIRAEDAGKAEEQSAIGAASEAKRDPPANGLRRLPQVDRGSDPAGLIPTDDLVQNYPVTSPSD
jgi:hypothetical protein